MTQAFILISAALLLIISLLHLFWAFGGKWGTAAVIPLTADHNKRLFSPSPFGTIIVAILLFGASYLLLAQSGYLASIMSNTLTRWGSILCAFVFLLRAVGDFRFIGFFKKVRDTAFARYDTTLFTPLCMWLSISFLLALL